MRNEKRGTWQLLGTCYRPTYYKLMTEVSLGDLVVCAVDSSVFDGIVTTITMQGVITSTDSWDYRGKLVKWPNVIEIKEKSVRVPNK